MKLNKIEDIVSGQKAFMPSGFEATLTKTDNGVDVQYNDGVDVVTDHYTNDEFQDLIGQGVEIIVKDYRSNYESYKKVNEESIESFEDVNPLTDVKDLDLPVELADTIPVDNVGEVITLQTLYDAICDLKATIADAVKQAVNTTPAIDRQDVEDDSLLDEITSSGDEEVDDEEIVDTEDVEVDTEPTDDELTEDVNAAKKQVDTMIKDKKSPDEIDAVIDYMTDNDNEKQQVTDYTISKMKESLLSTRRSSKLRGIIV